MASAAISSGALGSSGRHASMDGDSTSGSRTSDGPSDTGSSEEEAAAELARQAVRKGWVPNLSDVVGGTLLRQQMHDNAMHIISTSGNGISSWVKSDQDLDRDQDQVDSGSPPSHVRAPGSGGAYDVPGLRSMLTTVHETRGEDHDDVNNAGLMVAARGTSMVGTTAQIAPDTAGLYDMLMQQQEATASESSSVATSEGDGHPIGHSGRGQEATS